MGLKSATDTIRDVQAMPEPSRQDVRFTTHELNLIALLVARRALECNGKAGATLRSLASKLLRDRSTTPRLGGDPGPCGDRRECRGG